MKRFIKNLFKPLRQKSDGYHTMEELYEHRCVLGVQLCNAISLIDHRRVWWLETEDKDWLIIGYGTSDGQATYHIPSIMTLSFNKTFREKCKIDFLEFDGHTSKQALERLRYFGMDFIPQDNKKLKQTNNQ